MTILDEFLNQINTILANGEGEQLAQYLAIEPDGNGNFTEAYARMIEAVRSTFPASDNDTLENFCSGRLPFAVNGVEETPWNEFVRFMVTYLRYLTLINIHKHLETYTLLSELLQKATSALKHHSLGIIVLPFVVNCSRALASFAIKLDSQPELRRTLKQSGDEDGIRESLPERCANIIRGAFTECFKDRTGPPSGVLDGQPAGKRRGIYLLVNLCLRIIFKTSKLEAAQTIIEQVAQYSPPLSVFPKAQQVTYLYYLGRFHFVTSHFYCAHAALTTAYALSPKAGYGVAMACSSQRRLILVYLISANIILGRFPSQRLFQLPETQDLAPFFQPLVDSIRRGDLAKFRRITDFSSPFAPFFFKHRVMVQLTHRCEPLVWRSLIRKTFLLAGDQGDPQNRKAPTLDLNYVTQILRSMERRGLVPLAASEPVAGKRNLNWIFNGEAALAREDRYVDPDFRMPQRPGESILDELRGVASDTLRLPDNEETISIFCSLVSQGFLNGYVSRKMQKFAIQGARQRGALTAGFPRVWDVVKASVDEDIPGWKRGTFSANGANGAIAFGGRMGGTAPGPGSVVRLSGARAAGS